MGTVPQGACEHGFKSWPDTPRLAGRPSQVFVLCSRRANWAHERRAEVRGRAATGSSRRRRVFSCWGCLAFLLTSPCLVLSTRRLGRTPYFRDLQLRPAGRHTTRITKLEAKFFFTKIPLPSKPNLTERACGRRPCRVRTSCVQLVASHFQGEQPDPGASKITVYRLRSRNPPAFRTLCGHCAGRRGLLGKLYSE
ncbi:hypothetical protein HDG35_002745 [Paraburkholderia sp. JPY681]|uniref:Uncharacterized protein n=1 Tax=Paraburkholderia atlantica TaxID=2654982 RepID=D5WAD2_PARAM|nr:hypothetical protein BC1002_2153 [Paraburkholderia atlantica]MBB5506494.1 hypothetical protein [Paraburkholderia atlantica]